MPEFAEAVYTAMNEVCGTAPERTQWGYVNPNPPYGLLQADALEATLPETEATEEVDALVDRLRDMVQPFGCLPFFHRTREITRDIDSPKQNKVVVIHAQSILEIADVTCLTSAGVNYDIDDEMMQDTFADWDKRFGLTVLEVSNAYLRLRFRTAPENPKAFLKEIVTFCPTVLEVTETKAEYQKIMQDLQEHHIPDLWWD